MNFEIKNIRKRYGKKTPLTDVNFTVSQSKCVGILGKNGSGKSTLLSILAGVQGCDGGEFLLDGENLFKTAKTLTKLVGYVPQGNLIFSGTVRENIAFAKPDATDGEITRAAALSCADEFIEQLPDKAETIIGERGFGLSEGQIQRLAIARAILYDAPVILLDEATSALDEITEKKVLRNLKDLGKTVVLISHKKAALEICTRNITVTDGRFEEKTAGTAN